MTIKLGVFVGENNWGFFNEIYKELSIRYDAQVYEPKTIKTPVFYERVNRWKSSRDMQHLLGRNDVCFFEWASELLAAASHMPKTSRIVTRLHRYEMYQWVNKINWDAVDKIIVVSQAKKEEFAARFPSQTDKLIVIGPSTSLDKFTILPKDFTGSIGILCHLTPRKRVYDLVLTFYELLQKKRELHLHIAGGMDPYFEDYYYSLRSLVDDLRIQDKVTFYGNVIDTWDWYHNIDIFISNSYSEGLQVAPMEAMASGCYCLSHHWRGADELLPHTNLFYTNEELKNLLLEYCEIPDEEKLERKKQMRVIAQQNFDINKTINAIEGTIDSVVSNVKSKYGN